MKRLKKYYKKYPAVRWWRFQVLSKFFSTFPSSHWCLHNAYFHDDNDDNGGGGGNDDDDDENDRALSFATKVSEQARIPNQKREKLLSTIYVTFYLLISEHNVE